jgi:hypothetical protein
MQCVHVSKHCDVTPINMYNFYVFVYDVNLE